MEPATLLLFAASFLGAGGIQITHLSVPTNVLNGSNHIVLDCVYTLKPEEAERGLVVKWYFNNSPTPVYQWIPASGKQPQDLGVLKGKLNVAHRVTDNAATMHRALYIMRPTTELSGEYKCHVSTFEDEDFMTKKMVVYATEKRFGLTRVKLDAETVNITCSAEDLYPEPKMSLFKTPDGTRLTEPDVDVKTTAKKGSYDIRASAVLQDDDLESPTFFDCEVRIPDISYAVRKTIVYYPGTYQIPSGAAALGPSLLLAAAALAAHRALPLRMQPRATC